MVLEFLETPKTNGNIYLIGVSYGTTNKIKYRWVGDNRTRTANIKYTTKGRAYFCSRRTKYYIDEFM